MIVRFLWTFIALAMVVAPVATACKDPTLNAALNLGSWEPGVRLWPKAQTGSSGPFLALDPTLNPGVTAYTDPNTAATTGAGTTLGRFTQAAPSAVEFRLETGLPFTAYLNLTKPIIGSLYWSSSVPRIEHPGTTGTTQREEIRSSSG